MASSLSPNAHPSRLIRLVPSPSPEVADRFDDPAVLVEAVAAGDPRAHAALWDRHATALRAVLRRTLGCTFDVEDALQEVFIRFFRAAKQLREPARLRPYLVGIALRVARRELRRRRFKRWFVLTDDGAVPEVATSHDDGAREAVRRLYAILDELEVETRLVFVLRHIEELELTEVAEHLGISLATVKRRLARATPLVTSRLRRDPLLAPYVQNEAELKP
ncbi:MAG: sigma-70 family RNA polymerase sigma factor [Polyangiaceae bacterium]